MKELGQLQSRQGTLPFKVWAVSASGRDDARELADRFSPFRFIADQELGMIDAFGVKHEGGGPGGSDIAYPTLILVDGRGGVLWTHRAVRNTDRLPVATVLAEARRRLSN